LTKEIIETTNDLSAVQSKAYIILTTLKTTIL